MEIRLNGGSFGNDLAELPASGNRPQILVMTFKDGSQFIPAGSDLQLDGVKDWMWL